MGLGKAIKKGWSKTMGRGPLSVIGMGKGGAASSLDFSKGGVWDKATRELGHAAGYLTGANAMQDMIDAQNAANAQAQANAQRQAAINAGNQQQVNEAGTESAISKILKKKTALQRSIRTAGQQRLGD